VSATYNSYTGAVATSTDENGQVTTYAYADPGHLNRMTSVTRPDNAQITCNYDDVNFTVQVKSPVQGTNVVSQKSFADALGRTIKQQLLDSSGTSYSIVETLYDAWGRAYKVSNPHNGTAQYWTESRTDALGRPVKTLLPDAGQTTQSYSANTVTSTDPAGVQRKSTADGTGRLSVLFEPDVANGNALTQQTSYAYDVLNNLKQVTQGSQTRTFVFDALGRLTDSTTSEAGHFIFQYNNYNLLTQRTDARGVVTTYTYDTLNRPYQTIYNVGSTGVPATSTVTLNYGTNQSLFNNGRVTSMTDGSGSETYSYDRFGSVTQLQTVIGTTTYTTGYQYNLAGELTQLTYPSGRVVLQNYDAIGRLCAIGTAGSTCTIGTNYASGYAYNPAGQTTAFNYGNGVALTIGYNQDNLLLQSLQYKKNTTTLFALNYWYKNDATNCPSAPSAANGQIRCIGDTVDNGRSVVYGYDALYRLTGAVTTGSTGYPRWGLSETYDRYGNRTAQSVTAGSGPSSSVAVSATSNRITTAGYAYDANGNMTNDGANTLVFDAENNNVSSTNASASGTYTYDGHGYRVKKVSGGTTTVSIFSGPLVIAEYLNGAAPSSPTNENVYSGGQKIVAFQSGSTYYFHNDHLSPRVRTNTSGTIADQRGTYPYGETWYSPGQAGYMFTTYSRDYESGNDYALARSYVSRLGRFASPDKHSGNIGDPQSLNRYVYSLNDPTNMSDPSGMDPCTDIVAKSRKRIIEELEVARLGPSADEFNSDPLGQEEPGPCVLNGGGGDGGGGSYIPPLVDDSCPVGTLCFTVNGELPGVPPGVGSTGPALGNPYYNDPSNGPGLGNFGPLQITPGGGGGGADGGLAALLKASIARVQSDLAKADCAKDFKNPAATINKAGRVGLADLGPIKFVTDKSSGLPVSAKSTKMAQYNPVTGSVNLNTQINWADPAHTAATLNGGPYPYDALAGQAYSINVPSVNAAQLMDINILHELAHYNSAIGNPDKAKVERALWDDCID
jgi:RHS repeat-associated protein